MRRRGGDSHTTSLPTVWFLSLSESLIGDGRARWGSSNTQCSGGWSRITRRSKRPTPHPVDLCETFSVNHSQFSKLSTSYVERKIFTQALRSFHADKFTCHNFSREADGNVTLLSSCCKCKPLDLRPPPHLASVRVNLNQCAPFCCNKVTLSVPALRSQAKTKRSGPEQGVKNGFHASPTPSNTDICLPYSCHPEVLSSNAIGVVTPLEGDHSPGRLLM